MCVVAVETVLYSVCVSFFVAMTTVLYGVEFSVAGDLVPINRKWLRVVMEGVWGVLGCV